MECNAWHVYLVECTDSTLYCGITKDPARRLAEHNGMLPGGARYTSGRRPVKMLASRCLGNKSDALRLERLIKSRPRHEKLSSLECYGQPHLAAHKLG